MLLMNISSKRNHLSSSNFPWEKRESRSENYIVWISAGDILSKGNNTKTSCGPVSSVTLVYFDLGFLNLSLH